jgi:hypothetical protein
MYAVVSVRERPGSGGVRPPNRAERVRRLPALGHRDDERPVWRPSRPERVLARDLDGRPHAGERLEQLGGVPPRVVRRPAGDDLDLLDVCEHPRRERDVEVDVTRLDV